MPAEFECIDSKELWSIEEGPPHAPKGVICVSFNGGEPWVVSMDRPLNRDEVEALIKLVHQQAVSR